MRISPSRLLRQPLTLCFTVAFVIRGDRRAPRRGAGCRANCCRAPRPKRSGCRASDCRRATALLRQFVADRKIAGAVAAVARRGKVVYLEPVGLQSLESKAPMTEASLFRVYSMTKAVTAVGVMMLVEEASSGSPIPRRSILPEFKNVKVQDGGTGRAAAAVARDHRPGSAAAHLGPEPSHIRAVSANARCARATSACRNS